MLLKYIKKIFAVTLVSALFIILSTVFSYAEELNNATVTISSSVLNLREAPNTSSKVLGKYTRGKKLKVVDSSDGWYKVTDNGKTGWLSAGYVTYNNPKSSITKSDTLTNAQSGVVTGSNVNVRKGPGLTYNVITQQNKAAKVTVLDVSGSWYKIKTSDGISGWVSSTYIKFNSNSVKNDPSNNKAESNGNDEANTAPGKTSDSATGTETEAGKPGDSITDTETDPGKMGNSSTDPAVTGTEGDSTSNSEDQTGIGNDSIKGEIIEYAKSFLGTKYTYGGTSPDTGFDCSGFTKFVYEKFGIVLNRVAADQALQGTEVTIDELLPGDLVFLDTDGGNNNITHVGIYIGEGLFINAASGSSSGKVVMSDLNNSYWKNAYMTARRVLS